MLAPSREQVVPYVRMRLETQKVMNTVFFTSIRLAVSKTLLKGRKSNQDSFVSLVLPWLMKEKMIYKEKCRCSLLAPHGQFYMRKHHGPIDSCQQHRGLASTLLAQPESLRLLAVWIPEGINGRHGVSNGRSQRRGNYNNLLRCHF
jgi:hypothetical protein